jgi:2-oxoglutarate dehydrogenase E2 component (dihydrolipoamide succinyltransferase)
VPVELKVPSVGESITEVQVGEWLKNVGDSVRQDDVVVMLETDKVTVELPAPVSGTISQILLKPGTSANVGDIVGYMEEGPVAAAAPAAKKEEKKKDEKKPEAAKAAPAAKSSQQVASVPNAPATKAPEVANDLPAARVMPAAQRAASAAGVAASEVAPTGPGGRVLKEDVQRHVQALKAPAPAPSPSPVSGDERLEDVVPMTQIRKRIAARLVEAQQTAALLTTFNEVDMGAVQDLRKQYQEAFTAKYGIKVGFMSFFVKAAVDALRQFPAVNAEVRGTDIVYHNYCDIGVAVGGGKGLVVPIIRNAERLSFADIEKTIAEFGQRAKANTLKLDDLTGGTFTISNGGVYGSLLSTPIVNPPQSGILGLHAIQDRAVVVNGEIKVRPMMYVALTYDHRIVDGREAVSFLKRIKDAIEQPARMLLEV